MHGRSGFTKITFKRVIPLIKEDEITIQRRPLVLFSSVDLLSINQRSSTTFGNMIVYEWNAEAHWKEILSWKEKKHPTKSRLYLVLKADMPFVLAENLVQKGIEPTASSPIW